MDSQNHYQDADAVPFSPETVDEQLDALLTTGASFEERSAMRNAEFVQQVNEVAHEYSAIRDRVWERLSAQATEANSLPQSIETSRAGKKPSSSRERIPLMSENSLYPRRTGLQRLAVLAAACIMALVVGSLLLVLSLSHRPNTQTGGVSSAMPITSATHTGAQTFCDKRDLGWYSICSNNEEQVVNLKKTIGNNVFTIQTVYADINRVLLTYTNASPVTGSHVPNIARFTLSAQHGITLAQTGDAGNFNEKTGYSEGVVSFDIAQVPANTETLNLHLQMTLYSGMSHQLGGFSSDFSATLHAGRVTTWNQTVMVNGIAITLQRVVVSPSQTRLYVLSPKLQLAGDPQHSPYTLAVGNWNNNIDGFNGESLLTQGNNGSSVIGVLLTVNASLFNQYGEWTFKIASGAVVGGSGGTWIFHFTVPK